MADLANVETALVAVVSGAIYPSGIGTVPANGALTRVYRGWPEAAALDADLAAGCVNVTVFTEAGGRNTTRHLDQWFTLPSTGPALTVIITGNTITFGGTASAGQLVGVLADGASYVHATGQNESPALVASDLAALIRADRIVLISGSSIVIPGVFVLNARVVAEQPGMMPIRRQEQRFRITCWCPDPLIRDKTASCIDSALAQMNFIGLEDGSVGRIRYRSSAVIDQAQDAALYRRDLVYSVEYPTTSKALFATMLIADLTMHTPNQACTIITV